MSDSGTERSLIVSIISESCERRQNSGGTNGSLVHRLLSLLSCGSHAEENQMMSVIKGLLGARPRPSTLGKTELKTQESLLMGG